MPGTTRTVSPSLAKSIAAAMLVKYAASAPLRTTPASVFENEAKLAKCVLMAATCAAVMSRRSAVTVEPAITRARIAPMSVALPVLALWKAISPYSLSVAEVAASAAASEV